MKFFAVSKLFFLSFLLQATAFSKAVETPRLHITHEHEQHDGTAGFSGGPDTWYSITTNSYPESTPLSQSRNKGAAKGDVYLSPTGFTIGEAGDYYVGITAYLQNPTEDSTVLIPVFLALDEAFDQDDPSLIGGVVTLNYGEISAVNGDGIIRDVTPGTRISLVATNAGYPYEVPVVVVSWSISVHKIN